LKSLYSILLLLSASVMQITNCAAQEHKPASDIVAAMESGLANYPTEKAYLQFDKPYYIGGDTLYFKAYVTAGEQHKLSGLSGVLHVDLINTNNKIDQSIILQLDSGITWGDFALPDSLPAGNYRVRAYTQWMRNEGEKDFFEKTIAIGAVKSAPVGESLVKQPGLKPDVQFFPEGGSLVEGIRSKVAFKAIDADGLGIDVKGIVVDNKNRTIASFASTHLGTGALYFTPESGKAYTAKVTYPDGQQAAFSLPKAEPSGINLSINNDSIPEANVKIEANTAYFNANKGKAYQLVIYSGGTVVTVDCKLDSPVIQLDILKRKLHSGVATVTLFSAENEPLCERLLFIQNYDQLRLDIKTDKNSYAKREKVNFGLNAITRKDDPAEGHFSVSVINETLVPEDENSENNILSDLLLTSDLKGYVEQPGYYFADTSTVARQNLDVLMLTQGYRRFEWKQLLDNSYPPAVYRPEKGLEINGAIKSLAGKPINNGTVTLLPSKGGPILTSVSDADGVFHFRNLAFADTTHFVLSAVNAKGKHSTTITYDKGEPEPAPAYRPQNARVAGDTAMTVFVENEKLQQRELIKFDPSKRILLKEVTVKAKEESNAHSESYVPEAAADQVIRGKDILDAGPLSVQLAGMVHRVHFVPGTGNSMVPVWNLGGPLHVLVDGAPGNLDDVSIDRVASVEVLLPPNSYIYGHDGLNGVLVVTTQTRSTKDMPSRGVLPLTPKGFYKAREFYSPKYDTPTALNNKQRDLRSTIYWNPGIKTDKDGKASFDFYNADGTGTYKVTIEGIDSNGNIGRQVYRYKVE